MARLDLGLATPNVLAALLAAGLAALPFAALALPAAAPWRRTAMVAIGVLAAAGAALLAFTASRGGAVAAVLGLCVGLALLPGRWRWLPALALAAVAAGSALGSLGGRWQATAPEQPSVATRLHLWRICSVIAADHPRSGLDGAGFALACLASAEPPQHLRGGRGAPFGWALNDVLDQSCKHGAWSGVAVLAAACLPLAIGIAAWTRRCPACAGAAMAAGTAWLAAGMFSCVWFLDVAAAAVGWTGLALLAWCAGRAAGWRRVLLASAAAAVVAATAVGGLLGASRSWAGDQPRLVGVAGEVPWRLQPRAQPRGEVLYLRGPEEDVEETLRHAMRPIAAGGYAVVAARTTDGVQAMAHPRLVVARGGMASEALAVLAAGACDAVVLLDPPAGAAAGVASDLQVVALHGDLTPAIDRAAWSGRPGSAVLPCGRLWARRMALAWPVATHRLRQMQRPE